MDPKSSSAAAELTPLLVSACLLGDPVRYDAGHKWLGDERLAQWRDQGRLVPVCPEVAGGLPTPRPAAEIAGGSGAQVLAGELRIVDIDGGDPTEAFVAGARRALATARRYHCRLALLTDASPSCGSTQVYDGRFSGSRIAGEGVTAALLRDAGIEVFAPHQLEELARRLVELDTDRRR
ncbi:MULTISPECIES: DUF523 domain-containing protein [Halomonas]|uniref:DUF523 domain-containing protein n=1 Tax=Halomonas TaxID=2745 RepID=UPI0015E6AF2C|nr:MULTISPECIES: DUF523 domain-containing protein [Halomonas]